MISKRNLAPVAALFAAVAVVSLNPKSKADSTDESLSELRESHGECQREKLPEGLEPTSFPLDAGRQLHIVPCWAAAYNFGSLIFVTEAPGKPRLVAFDEYSPDGKRRQTEVLVNVEFDPESGVLTSFNKARGIGDCGSMGKWRWRAGAFQLVEFRARECGGEPVKPSEWPVLYRARE